MYNIAFPNFGLYFYIDKVAFNLLGRPIYWYGLFIAGAIVLAFFLAKKVDGKYNIKYSDVESFALIAIPVSIIGARVYYVIFSWGFYKENLGDIFKIWNGGLAIYGAIICAILTAIIFCNLKKISLFDLLDYTVPFLALSQAIGRWGNFTNREAYGAITNSLFKMQILTDNGGYISVHPTFLYESVGLFLIFLVLWRKDRNFSGQKIAIYCVSYGVLRFFIEYLRTDSLYIGQIKASMLVSACFFVLGIVIYYLRSKKVKN